MPPPQYVSPFPPIHLSHDECEMLIRTANELVAQAQKKYEWFLWQDRERLDFNRWRLVRDQDDMSVYVDSRQAKETGNRDVQCLLTTGSVSGTLKDAMYGTLNPTTDAMKLKTAYLQDTLLDGAVLETILEPTPDQPFQSLTLRWFVKGVPFPVRAVTNKHGDNVSIEATGVRELYGGEQIGFHLTHSVILAETPPLPQYQRCNISTCTFWRQARQNRVQAYMTCYIELPETFVTSLQVKSIADAFAAESKAGHCARMKKLAWFMQQKASSAKEMGENGSTRATKQSVICCACGFKLPSVFEGSLGCDLCSEPVCGRCRVKHEIFTVGPEPKRELVKTKVRVCQACMKTVDDLDATMVARHEALTGDQLQDGSLLQEILGRECRASTVSSVTSSTSDDSNSI